jgi:hypothetical protein
MKPEMELQSIGPVQNSRPTSAVNNKSDDRNG